MLFTLLLLKSVVAMFFDCKLPAEFRVLIVAFGKVWILTMTLGPVFRIFAHLALPTFCVQIQRAIQQL